MEETVARRHAVETIHDIANAMRAIAAGRIQEAQRALTCARRYENVVLQALSILSQDMWQLLAPAKHKPVLLVALMSEQPLCGTFNQELIPLLQRRREELMESGSVELAVVGHRGTRLLEAHGIKPEITFPAAVSLPGLRELVKNLSQLVGHRFAAGELNCVRIIYNRYHSISEQIPTELQILPPDLQRLSSQSPPTRSEFHRYLNDATLFAGLVSELAFIDLYCVAADSFTSEQAARLIAMDGATRNTERLLRELIELEQRERQDEITRQVLELIGSRFVDSNQS